MVGIYSGSCGHPFTGLIAENEEQAWAYLDDKYGSYYEGIKFGCNHDAFIIEEVKMITYDYNSKD